MSFYRNKRKTKDDDFLDDEEEEEEESSEEEGRRSKSKKDKVSGKKSQTMDKSEGKIDPEIGICACKISKNRKVVVREFRKIILIDIREYYGEDEMKPSKKGISLSLEQWKVLSQNIDKVDEAIQEMS